MPRCSKVHGSMSLGETHRITLCEKLVFLSRSPEWPLTPTSDEARALVCDRQMKPDGRVFERDVWLDGRTHVVRPAAASGRTTEKIWPLARSGLGQPRQRRVKRSCLRGFCSTLSALSTILLTSLVVITHLHGLPLRTSACVHTCSTPLRKPGLGLWSGDFGFG